MQTTQNKLDCIAENKKNKLIENSNSAQHASGLRRKSLSCSCETTGAVACESFQIFEAVNNTSALPRFIAIQGTNNLSKLAHVSKDLCIMGEVRLYPLKLCKRST